MTDFERDNEVRFQIIGTLPSDEKVQLLVAKLQELGGNWLLLATDEDVRSPSITIDSRIERGEPMVAVNDRSVAEFLASEGNIKNSSSVAATIMRPLATHATNEHRAPNSKRNYFGRECWGCNCPLQTTGPLHLYGIDPLSLLAFSDLPDDEINAIDVRGIGPKLLGHIRRIAEKMRQDLGLDRH